MTKLTVSALLLAGCTSETSNKPAPVSPAPAEVCRETGLLNKITAPDLNGPYAVGDIIGGNCAPVRQDAGRENVVLIGSLSTDSVLDKACVVTGQEDVEPVSLYVEYLDRDVTVSGYAEATIDAVGSASNLLYCDNTKLD